MCCVAAQALAIEHEMHGAPYGRFQPIHHLSLAEAEERAHQVQAASAGSDGGHTPAGGSPNGELRHRPGVGGVAGGNGLRRCGSHEAPC